MEAYVRQIEVGRRSEEAWFDAILRQWQAQCAQALEVGELLRAAEADLGTREWNHLVRDLVHVEEVIPGVGDAVATPAGNMFADLFNARALWLRRRRAAAAEEALLKARFQALAARWQAERQIQVVEKRHARNRARRLARAKAKREARARAVKAARAWGREQRARVDRSSPASPRPSAASSKPSSA
jgi:hypothetical protein